MATFNDVVAAIRDYLTKNPGVAANYSKHDLDFPASALPSEYNDTPYRDIIDDGKFSRTLGEYKEFCQKHEGLY